MSLPPSQKNIKWINITPGFKQAKRLYWITQAMKTLLSRGAAGPAGHIQDFTYLSQLSAAVLDTENCRLCAIHTELQSHYLFKVGL